MKNSLIICLAVIISGFVAVFSQNPARTAESNALVPTPPSGTTAAKVGSPFRIGERLSFNVSFGKITDAAYAEIYVVSRGKLAGREAVELQARFKTMNLVSAFYPLDESRLTYVSAETGLPLYSKVVSSESVQPREAVKNFLENPAVYHDLLTAVYHARSLGSGTGTFSFYEDDKIYSATMQTNGATERVVTDTGEYDTTVSVIQSTFFDQIGLKDFRVNFTNDEARLPALIRFKSRKGDFRAALASVQLIQPEVAVQTEPTLTTTPVPVPTPTPFPTPRPALKATPYIENQPLPAELPFALGETLNFRVTSQNQPVGTVIIQAKERRMITGRDGLLLSATVTTGGAPGGVLNAGDSIKSFVDPLSLVPINLELKLSGLFASYNQTVQFDQTAGVAFDSSAARFEVPVGTHNLLSLAYAVRSFNLTPSKNPTNPVNDTRVAIFWKDQPYVLTLRPLNTETIDFEGRKITAQIVSVTGNPQLDQMNMKIWLSVDERRLPLRMVVGGYRAELLAAAQMASK